MKTIVALLLALLATAVPAQGPQQFELVYRFTFNGQHIGHVSDSFKREDSRYRLTSIARPDKKLAFLLPVMTLTSEGMIQSGSFIPSRYRQVRSNAPNKAVTSEFDWTSNQLTHRYKGRVAQADLAKGTQDALTQLYSFTLAGAAPPKLEFAVSNGRKLINYRYEKIPAGHMVTPLGSFETVEYRRITTEPDENAISVWIAPALHHLPLRIRVREESGLFEQHLIRANYKAL